MWKPRQAGGCSSIVPRPPAPVAPPVRAAEPRPAWPWRLSGYFPSGVKLEPLSSHFEVDRIRRPGPVPTHSTPQLTDRCGVLNDHIERKTVLVLAVAGGEDRVRHLPLQVQGVERGLFLSGASDARDARPEPVGERDVVEVGGSSHKPRMETSEKASIAAHLVSLGSMGRILKSNPAAKA